MATAGRQASGDNHFRRQPSRWARNGIVLALLVALGALAWAWPRLREEALVGSAYAARVGCVCRFVSGRPLESCDDDIAAAGFSGAAGFVSLSQEPATRTVVAGIPLLAHQSARFTPGSGCQLEPWRG